MTRDQIMRLATLAKDKAIEDILQVDPARDIDRELLVVHALLGYLSYNLYVHRELINE